MIFFLKSSAGEWVALSIFNRGMSSYTQSDPGSVIVGSKWFPNDGVVNTISMKSPPYFPLGAG